MQCLLPTITQNLILLFREMCPPREASQTGGPIQVEALPSTWPCQEPVGKRPRPLGSALSWAWPVGVSCGRGQWAGSFPVLSHSPPPLLSRHSAGLLLGRGHPSLSPVLSHLCLPAGDAEVRVGARGTYRRRRKPQFRYPSGCHQEDSGTQRPGGTLSFRGTELGLLKCPRVPWTYRGCTRAPWPRCAVPSLADGRGSIFILLQDTQLREDVIRMFLPPAKPMLPAVNMGCTRALRVYSSVPALPWERLGDKCQLRVTAAQMGKGSCGLEWAGRTGTWRVAALSPRAHRGHWVLSLCLLPILGPSGGPPPHVTPLSLRGWDLDCAHSPAKETEAPWKSHSKRTSKTMSKRRSVKDKCVP